MIGFVDDIVKALAEAEKQDENKTPPKEEKKSAPNTSILANYIKSCQNPNKNCGFVKGHAQNIVFYSK